LCSFMGIANKVKDFSYGLGVSLAYGVAAYGIHSFVSSNMPTVNSFLSNQFRYLPTVLSFALAYPVMKYGRDLREAEDVLELQSQELTRIDNALNNAALCLKSGIDETDPDVKRIMTQGIDDLSRVGLINQLSTNKLTVREHNEYADHLLEIYRNKMKAEYEPAIAKLSEQKALLLDAVNKTEYFPIYKELVETIFPVLCSGNANNIGFVVTINEVPRSVLLEVDSRGTLEDKLYPGQVFLINDIQKKRYHKQGVSNLKDDEHHKHVPSHILLRDDYIGWAFSVVGQVNEVSRAMSENGFTLINNYKCFNQNAQTAPVQDISVKSSVLRNCPTMTSSDFDTRFVELDYRLFDTYFRALAIEILGKYTKTYIIEQLSLESEIEKGLPSSPPVFQKPLFDKVKSPPVLNEPVPNQDTLDNLRKLVDDRINKQQKESQNLTDSEIEDDN